MANQFNKDDMQQFRSTANNYGYENLNFDGKNVTATKNGNSYLFKTDGLTNVNGRLYGTKEQLNDIFSNPYSQVRNTAVSQGVNVGYNQYNQPVLNGQAVATNGMVNSGGNWYMEGGALGDLLSGVAYKEYENPYQDNLVDYLDQLANYKEFSYDADSDESLKAAQDEAMTLMMQKAYDMGRGNTSWMDYQTQKVAQDLIPQFEQKAYDRYINERNYLADLFNMTRGLSQDSFNEFNARETLNETRRHNNAQEDYNNRLLANEDRDYAFKVSEAEKSNAREDKRLAESINQFTQTMDFEKAKFTADEVYRWVLQQFEVNKYTDEQTLNRVLQKWFNTGEADEEVSRVLGVPVGEKTIDRLNYELATGKFDYQKQKSNNNNNNNNPKNDGKVDPVFGEVDLGNLGIDESAWR